MTTEATGADAFHPLVAPTGGERLALRVVQLGAIAVVFAATPRKVFDLDRFLVPKELVLHLTALLAGLIILGAIRRVKFTRVDQLLLIYLALSAISAALATNRWLGMRGFAISVSSLLLFWTGRALRQAGLSHPLLSALALAVVLAAVTSLAQAYGVRTELFSLNRSPGGTLGNRNFVAHAAAFGLPIIVIVALGARAMRGYLMASIGVMLTTATLVLTRSRAAWLAYGVVVVVLLASMVVSPSLRRNGRTWLRFGGIVLMTGAGVVAALFIPNTLRWRSENPYVESVRGVANYQEGSGRGRLIQYERSLLIAVRHPLFGAGPGNWAVEYPRQARDNDPSINPSEPGTTFNPWPSSDWIAFIVERGIAAAVVLGLALLAIALGGLRQIRSAHDLEEARNGVGLTGTAVAAAIAGALDAVLLLPLPSLIIWPALGALWLPEVQHRDAEPRSISRLVLLALVVAAGLSAVRSAGQIAAMELYATSGSRSSLLTAARLDPGNYRVQVRLASGGSRKVRCPHALAARELFPNAEQARALSRGCGER